MGTNKLGGLTLKEQKFCHYFVSEEFFGNGKASYFKAFGYKKKSSENAAKVQASILLNKPEVLKCINELLDIAGFNDVHVDKQLLMLITQNIDYSTKIAAIREYNKLKARITERHLVMGKVDMTMEEIEAELKKLHGATVAEERPGVKAILKKQEDGK